MLSTYYDNMIKSFCDTHRDTYEGAVEFYAEMVDYMSDMAYTGVLEDSTLGILKKKVEDDFNILLPKSTKLTIYPP